MNYGKLTRNLLLGGVAVLGVAMIAPAQAGIAAPETLAAQDEQANQDDDGLAELVVTAQRREELLQDVPIAVSAATAETLETTGIDATKDLPQLVPSVQFTRSGPSGLFFVRGVGTTNGAAGEEGSNAVYIDGVYMGDLGQTINNFNNIQRIEVLKGPQGTLFGRNATGGLIHIITREPGDALVVSGEFGYANYETVSSRLYIGGPITDNVSADIAWTGTHQNDGWGSYLNLGNRKAHIQDNWGLRSKLVLRASDSVKFTVAGDYYENKDNLYLAWKLDPGTLGSLGNPGLAGFDTTANRYSLTDQTIWGISLTGEADLGFATLTSISAYRKNRNNSGFDVDAGPANLVAIDYHSGSKSLQQELRLASQGSGPFSWQLGAFYLHLKSGNDSTFSGLGLAAVRPELTPGVFSAVGTSRQQIFAELETDSYAAFGEASYEVTPTTTVTAGLRYTADRRSFIGSQTSTLLNGTVVPSAIRLTPSGTLLATPGTQNTKLSYNAWTYRVAIRQELTDDVNVYASVNRGFKSGSYSLQNPLNEPYLPQYIMAYEVGLKSELFDRKLRLNLAAFHYDIDDYQVRSAAVANPGSSLVLNAATVKVDGVELEFEAAPVRDLRIFGGATYLNSRYGNFGGPGSAFFAPIVYPNPATCPLAQRGTENPGVLTPGPRTGGFTTCFGDVSGNKVSNSPEFTASLGASYTASIGEEGRLRFSALYNYNSGYYFEPDNIAEQKGFSLVNASIEYRPEERFGVELWVRNLTDKEYAVQKITTGTGVATALGAPRTYGVNVKFDF